MHKFGGGTDDLLLGTTGYTALSVGASGDPVDFGGFVEDLVLTTSITSGSTAQRLRDLQFSFEVVPEPSSTRSLRARRPRPDAAPQAQCRVAAMADE